MISLQKALQNYLHERNIKDEARLKKFVEQELCDWYNKNYNKKHSNIDMFIKTDFEHFLNAYSYNIQRKVQKGNFIYLDNKVYVPYNQQNKRVLMKEKGIINVYKSIKEGKGAKWFIRYWNDKCYLKRVNKDNDFIDIKVFDDSLAYDETQEIILGLQEKNLELSKQINELKWNNDMMEEIVKNYKHLIKSIIVNGLGGSVLK